MATYVRTQSIESDIGSTGQLSITITSSDTRIRAVAGDAARVRATFSIAAASDADADRIFEECQLRVSQGDGSLVIEEPKNLSNVIAAVGRLIGRRGAVEAEIDVEAPPGCSLRFEGVSADISVNGMQGEQRYRTVSGDILLNDAAGDIRVNGVSADVTLRGSGALKLRNNAVSGDLSAIAPRFIALDAVSVSGDIELEAAFDAAGDHRIETVSGDLGVGLVGAATFEVRGMSTDITCRLPNEQQGRADRRRVLVAGGGGATLRFSSMSGDLSIRAPRRLVPDETLQTPEGTTPDEDELATLRALERGEIDVDEATRRLASGNDR